MLTTDWGRKGVGTPDPFCIPGRHVAVILRMQVDRGIDIIFTRVFADIRTVQELLGHKDVSNTMP